jgi:hypothetical protein
MENTIPKGFLEEHEHGEAGKREYVALKEGFLRLSYGKTGRLSKISFGMEKSGPNIGAALEFGSENGEGTITLIEEMGSSGLQWQDGKVTWGSTFEGVEGDPSKAQVIGKSEWVDEILQEMINPSDKLLAEQLRLDYDDLVYFSEIIPNMKDLETKESMMREHKQIARVCLKGVKISKEPEDFKNEVTAKANEVLESYK